MGKITKEDLTSVQFPKAMSGYDTKAVDTFLQNLAKQLDEWQKILEQAEVTALEALSKLESMEEDKKNLSSPFNQNDEALSSHKIYEIIEFAKNKAQSILDAAHKKALESEKILQNRLDKQELLIDRLQRQKQHFIKKWKNLIEDEVHALELFNDEGDQLEQKLKIIRSNHVPLYEDISETIHKPLAHSSYGLYPNIKSSEEIFQEAKRRIQSEYSSSTVNEEPQKPDLELESYYSSILSEISKALHQTTKQEKENRTDHDQTNVLKTQKEDFCSDSSLLDQDTSEKIVLNRTSNHVLESNIPNEDTNIEKTSQTDIQVTRDEKDISKKIEKNNSDTLTTEERAWMMKEFIFETPKDTLHTEKRTSSENIATTIANEVNQQDIPLSDQKYHHNNHKNSDLLLNSKKDDIATPTKIKNEDENKNEYKNEYKLNYRQKKQETENVSAPSHLSEDSAYSSYGVQENQDYQDRNSKTRSSRLDAKNHVPSENIMHSQTLLNNEITKEQTKQDLPLPVENSIPDKVKKHTFPNYYDMYMKKMHQKKNPQESKVPIREDMKVSPRLLRKQINIE